MADTSAGSMANVSGISLGELLGTARAYQAGSQDATAKVLDAIGTQQQINAGTVGVYEQDAKDSAEVAAAKVNADYQTQLARVKAANAFGSNLKNNTEVITGLASAAQDAYDRRAKALSNVQHNNEISFLDHPIDFIVGQLKNGSELYTAELAEQQQHAAEERIQAINLNTQSTVATQNAINEPLTAASAEIAARQAAVASTVAANKAKIDGINYGINGIQYALNAKKSELETLFNLKQAQNSEQSLGLQRQSLDLQQKEFAFRQQEFADRQADKHEQQKLGQDFVDTINLGRKALLGDNYTPLDDMNGRMALGALKGKSPLSAELQKYYDAGERARLTGNASYGNTPAQAADTLQTLPIQVNPTQGAIKGILGQAAKDTNEALKNAELPGQNKNPVFQGIDKKDKKSIEAAYNARAQQILNDAAKVVKPGDTDNPYQIGSINSLAQNSPTIQGLPVYQKVLKPLVDSGVQLTDPSQILGIVGDAVAKGTITHKEALDLTTIYHVGVAANNAMRNFEGFGLKPSWNYNAKVETNSGAFQDSDIVNMTDPTAVSRALLKRNANKMRSNMVGGNRLID